MSGMICASVLEISGLGVRGEGESLMSEALCFSSATASDELPLELAIVAGRTAGVHIRLKRAFWYL